MVHREHKSSASAEGLRIAIVVSRYHDEVTEALQRGALDAFTDAGGAPEDLAVIEAPGAFELPVLCAAVVATGVDDRPVDGVVALGCVITGETTHDEYINTAVSSALAALSARTRTPIAFGVLTCRTMEQARERAGGAKGNKGAEAMQAAIETIRTMQSIGAAHRTGKGVKERI